VIRASTNACHSYAKQHNYFLLCNTIKDEFMGDRIQQLLQFLTEDPEDEFTHYALALEYLKVDVTKAKAEFENLLVKHPSYLPTYYPAAHLLIELGQQEEAEQLFLKGIELAKTQGNNKTRLELQSAYMVFQTERD
jgi:tetratricopeptide (TPR) repeat protein